MHFPPIKEPRFIINRLLVFGHNLAKGESLVSDQLERTSGQENNSAIDPALFREGYPWRVVTDLNELCNIQCTYCHISSLYGPEAKNARTLDPKLVGQLLLDANAMQVFDVTLTGGEITTLRNFDEYLENINALDFTSVQVITNGTRLTRQRAEQLKAAGVTRVSISIDGPQASNDKARGDGVFHRAWQGAEQAIAAGLTVNVISVLGLHNIEDWEQLTPQLKELGVRSQNVSLMCRLGRAEKAEEWMGVPEDRLDEVREKARRLQVAHNDENFAVYLNDGVMQEPGWSGAPTPLHAFQDQNPGIEAVVKVNGDVLRNRLYGMSRAIGNIAVMRLPDVWHEDKTRRASLKDVVGDQNVGALPNLYYHYTPLEGKTRSVGPNATTTSNAESYLRVRHEPWGTVTFDTRTFSIVDVKQLGVTYE